MPQGMGIIIVIIVKKQKFWIFVSLLVRYNNKVYIAIDRQKTINESPCVQKTAEDNTPDRSRYFFSSNPNKYVRKPRGINIKATDCGEAIIPLSRDTGMTNTKKDVRRPTFSP